MRWTPSWIIQLHKQCLLVSCSTVIYIVVSFNLHVHYVLTNVTESYTHALPAILTVGWLDTAVVCKLWRPPESGWTPSDSRGQPWHTGKGKDNNDSSEDLNLCSQSLCIAYDYKMWRNTTAVWTTSLLDLGWIKSSVHCQPGRPWPDSWATTTSRSKCGTGDRGEVGCQSTLCCGWKWWCGACILKRL